MMNQSDEGEKENQRRRIRMKERETTE